ncbi:MAG: YdgA family protein [Azoarcus sp.]|jgi:uncharacterized protein YdgA (DUF945 family)|nr:YdgA family protein [Azoarcus sp.]
MNNTATKVVGALVVILAVLGVGSYWAGGWIEQAFRDAAAKTTQYGLTVNVIDYQRGLLGATARTEATFTYNGEPVTVLLNHDIQHGPLPALTAAARVHTVPELPEDRVAQFNDIFGGDPFGGKPPFTVDTAIGWGGGINHHIVSPKFEATIREDKTRVVWGGLNADVEINSAQTHVRTRANVAGLDMVKSEDNQLKLGHLELEGEFDLNELESYGLVGGKWEMEVDKFLMRAKDDESPARAIEVQAFKGDMRTDFADGALNVTTHLGADKIALDGDRETIGDAKLTFQSENLDVKALEVLSQAAQSQEEDLDGEALDALSQQAAQESGQKLDPKQVEAIARAASAANAESSPALAAAAAEVDEDTPFLNTPEQLAALQELAKRKPAFSISDASGRWPEGEVKAAMRIAYVGKPDGAKPATPVDSVIGLADLAADVRMTLPRALVARLLTVQVSDEVADTLEDDEASEENVQKVTKEQVEQRIQEMLGEKLLVEKDGALSLEANYHNDQLRLNGNKAPLESLLGLLPLLPF